MGKLFKIAVPFIASAFLGPEVAAAFGVSGAVGGAIASGGASLLTAALAPDKPAQSPQAQAPPLPPPDLGTTTPAPVASGAAQSLLAPADPVNTDAAAARSQAADEERQRVSRARGFAATNPTGGRGDLSTPNLASKSLLGA